MSIFNPVQGAAYDAQGQLIPNKTLDTSTTTETTAAVEPQTTTTTETIPASETQTDTSSIDWAKELSEKTGGKFSSWDDLTSELTKPRDIQYANDDSKRVFEYLKEGKVDDVLNVYAEQRRLSAIDNMSDADLVKMAMEYKAGSLSSDEINDEFSSRYTLEKPEAPSEDDYIDDDAFKKAQKDYNKELRNYEKQEKAIQRSLKVDAAQAREYLSGLRKDIILPDLNTSSATATEEIGPSQADLDKMWKEYNDSLNKTSSSFKEIPFEVNDEGVVFKGSYQVDDAERQQLTKDLAEKHVINDILMPRYIKGDAYDTDQLMNDIYFLNNKEKIISNAVKQAVAQDRLNALRDRSNVDLNQGRGNGTMPNNVEVSEFAKAFFKG